MAQSTPTAHLSIAEKVSFFTSAILIPIYIPFIVLRHLIFPPANSPGIKRAVAQHILGSLLATPIRYQRAYLPENLTGSSVVKFCTQSKPHLPYDTISLSHAANLHIIGPSADAESKPKILLFFHGGGYVYAAGPSHIPFAYACSQSYSTPSSPALLAVLEYTLTPVAPYPRQLRQAIAALNHVLTLTSPSQIVIVGDSAGAHLAVSLLAHILHPNESPALQLENVKFDKGDKLGGLCIISPLLSYDVTKPSYTTNASTDYISPNAVYDSLINLSPPPLSTSEARKNPQLNPGDKPSEYWIDCPAESILVTIGEREVFYSSCIEFVDKLKVSGVNVELTIGEGEWHDAPIVDQIFKLEPRDGASRPAILKWIHELGSRKI